MTGAPAPAPADGLGRQIARNSVLNVAGRFVYVMGWAALAPYMLHQLGDERFGLWSLLSVVAGLYLSLDLGLASTLTRFVAEYRASGDRPALRSVFTIGVLIYGALSLAFLVAIVVLREPLIGAFKVPPALRPEVESALVVAAATYGLLNASMLVASVLGGLQRMDIWNRITMVTTLVQLAGAALVLSRGGGLVALMVNTGVSLLIGAWWGRLWLRRLAPEIGWDAARVEGSLTRRLLRYGLALQVINLGVLFQFQLDKVLFGSLLSLRAAGEYELAHRAVIAMWSVPSLLLPALVPAAAHLDAGGDRERLLRLYRRASRYVLACAFPIAAGIVALSPALARAWLGPGHDEAAWAMAALGAMLGVNVLTGAGTAIARGMNRPGLEVRYQLLAMALHLAASLVLIPRLGFTGGLWSLFLSTSLASLVFLAGFHRLVREPLGAFARSIVAPPLVAAMVGGAVAAWITRAVSLGPAAAVRAEALVQLIAGGVALAAIAGGLMLAIRYVSWDELAQIVAALRGRRPPATLGEVPRAS